MNLRQRTLAVMKGEKPDFVPWLGDLDYWISAWKEMKTMPEKYQGDGIFRLHQDLGVGFYLQGYFPFTEKYEVKIEQETHGNKRTNWVRTPIGDIYSLEKYLPQSYCWATEEHYIKTWRDLKILRYWYEHTHYVPNYQEAEKRVQLVAENGVVLCYLPKSPFMQLAALDAGISAVTFCLADAPDEFNETLEVLDKKFEEAAFIALHSPAECLMIPENLSSEMIGKKNFLRYMRPYEEFWIKAIHETAKFSFIHMDGTLKGLIREVAETGFTVMEALTPSPVGDLSLLQMREAVRDHSVIWGGIPGLYFSDLVSDLEFDRFVISTLEMMREDQHCVLGVADQVPPGSRWERIQRVSELVEQYGGTS